MTNLKRASVEEQFWDELMNLKDRLISQLPNSWFYLEYGKKYYPSSMDAGLYQWTITLVIRHGEKSCVV